MTLFVELTDIAHGGESVGRVDGRVVFVRGGIPGERVQVELVDEKKSFARGFVVAVDRPSPDRIEPVCEIAPRCGGCDFSHVSIERQRQLKAGVVKDALRRFAALTWDGDVQPVSPDMFGWRTRMRYHRGPHGVGMKAPRSDTLIPLPQAGCLLAHPDGRHLAGDAQTVTVAHSGVAADGRPQVVRERVHGREFCVDANGFWQVHPQAASVLVDAVLDGLAPQPGEHGLDLYCGVGLFARFLADAKVNVRGIEGNVRAVAHARKNVATATFQQGDVAACMRGVKRADVVVLDPPRAGAKKKVVEAVAALHPRAVAYVACDPVALARDLATFRDHGYALTKLSAFDVFPMTSHVECVAILHPAAADGGIFIDSVSS